MAERLDVAGRLAEGQPAVEHTQTYVRACQVLGYHDPELTSRPTQISDWYDSEEGLNLRALDGDCAQLRAAAARSWKRCGCSETRSMSWRRRGAGQGRSPR